MFPVNFKKERAEYYLQCFSGGSEITPESNEGWTINDMLGLGGACLFALSSHGPVIRKAASEQQGVALEQPQHPEHQEADEQQVFCDLRAALDWVANLTMLIKDGDYDASFERELHCATTQEGQVTTRIIPIEGFKNIPPGKILTSTS